MKKIIIIAGPTGTGKSEVAINLGELLNTEVISADSVQIYRGFDIGSGKVSFEEMRNVKHHLIDILNPTEKYNAQIFQDDAKKLINSIHDKKKIPIICGGTNLYIHSLLYDIDFGNKIEDANLRKKLDSIYDSEGVEALYKILEKLDPLRASQIDKHNHRRIIRAIELAESGSLYTNNFRKVNRDFKVYYYILQRERQSLYSRINARVLKMVKDGLYEEVKNLYDLYGDRAPALKTIGYKECISYINHELDYQLSIEKIQQHSRNLAKRQLTWYRKEKECIPINIDEKSANEVAQLIYRDLQKEEVYDKY